MQRNVGALQSGSFDVVVIGGGIFGACAAWDAAQRGLSVALIERGDFGGATSANSFRILHGGIRYLQHGDLKRLRRSCKERRAFLRIAPHLVRPLPIVVPTYGRGKRGQALLRAGMAVYDALTPDRNSGIADPALRIERGRLIDRSEALSMFPGLDDRGLTGAGIFADGQIINPPRLVLAVVKSAVALGATAANYVEATGLLTEGRRVTGVTATDALTGEVFDIRAGVVVNAAGPYAEHFLKRALGAELSPPGTYSRDVCFVVPRPWLHPDHALAAQASTHDPDAIVSRGARHLFFAPWRDWTIVGTWHKVHPGAPNHLGVSADELDAFVKEANAGYGGFTVRRDEISVVNAGLVPFGENQDGSPHLRYGHRSRVIDHASSGTDGLISLIGVRLTTGRWGAERAIDLACAKLGRATGRSQTASTPVSGGDIGNVQQFVSALAARHGSTMTAAQVGRIARDYGSEAERVLALAATPALATAISGTDTLAAEVEYCVREEMAVTLADVVFRRTALAAGQHPSAAALSDCADAFGRASGLPRATIDEQLAAVMQALNTGATPGG